MPWPFVHCNLDRELGFARLCQQLAQLNFGTLVLLPKGTVYLGTQRNTLLLSVCVSGACPGAYALPSHGSQQNTCIVAACKVDVNMLSYDYGQTYDQTHHGSFRAARQASYRDDQAVVRLPFRRGSDTVGDQDGGTSRVSACGRRPFTPMPGRQGPSGRIRVVFFRGDV